MKHDKKPTPAHEEQRGAMRKQRLFSYPVNQDLTDAVENACSKYVKLFGYRPDNVMIRLEEQPEEWDTFMKVEAVQKGLMPHHFMLGDIIDKRQPRILKGKRCGIYE